MQILKPETLFVGQHSIYFEKLNSTNEYIKDYLKGHPIEEGFGVIAGQQSKGKGQNGKEWWSHQGKNLLSSFLFFPGFLSAEHMHFMVFTSALATRATVQKLLPSCEVTIKWPNDILINGLKIAGILIENVGIGKNCKCVVGVGINVNQTEFREMARTPTSLKLIMQNKDLDLAVVYKELCHWLEKYYMTLRSPNGMQQIHKLYVSQLYRLNETITLMPEKSLYQLIGVGLNGKLMLDNGQKRLELTHNEKVIDWN